MLWPGRNGGANGRRDLPSLGSANNANILQILDKLNNNNSEAFSYDNLNRIAAFTNGNGTMEQTYTTDPWGNMAMSGTATSSLVFTGASTNRDTSGDLTYDASGNALSVYNGISRPTFTYDAEGKMLTANSGTATYTYDADGNRVRKDTGGTWTEYLYFNGQPIAEKSANGTWSDYIYAEGRRIARADGYDIRIHLSGTNCSNCGTNPNMFAGVTSLTPTNYVIRNGDLLTWRQYQDGVTVGGIFFGCYDSSGNFVSGTSLTDTDGQPIDADTTKNTWHVRTVDLSSFAGMKVASIDPFQWTSAPPGSWDIYFGDIVLVSTGGSFIPIYSRGMFTLGIGTNPTVSNLAAVTEKVTDSSPLTTTTYYHSDQIGSTQMTTSGTGWPISSNIYYPYGQGPAPGLNHYLFTGKERDTESGNDYFGARYYASSMGRFLSPDPGWFISAHPENPQSWNQYSYVLNNPLSFTDPTGLDCVYLNDAGNGIEEVDADVDTSQRQCSKTGGSYVPGQLTGYATDSSDPDNTITKLQYSPYTSNADFTGPQPSVAGSYMNVNPSTIPLTPSQLTKLIAENNNSQLPDSAIACVIGIKSGGDPQAVAGQGGKGNPYKGLPIPGNSAKGLMQVMNGATQDMVQNKYFTGMGAQ